MRNLIPALILILPAAAHAHEKPLVPLCVASQIALNADPPSAIPPARAGTLLSLRNISDKPCSYFAKPLFQFIGADGKLLDLNFAIPAGVRNTSLRLPPVVLPAGTAATARMTWLSGPADAQTICLDATAIVLDFGKFSGGALEAPLAAHICGPPHKQVTYILEPLHPAPCIQPLCILPPLRPTPPTNPDAYTGNLWIP